MPAAGPDEMILHHFDASPFSEKVRLAFGLKGLAWRSTIILQCCPSPTTCPDRGYRRTPSMQIGADVYCDTQVIPRGDRGARPLASLLGNGLDWAVNLWADRLFFGATVPVIFGLIATMCEGLQEGPHRDVRPPVRWKRHGRGGALP